MSWLKRQLRRLRLKRRCPDPPEESVKTIIVVFHYYDYCFDDFIIFVANSKNI